MIDVRRLDPSAWAVHREVRLAALAESPRAFGTTLERASARTEAEWQAPSPTASTSWRSTRIDRWAWSAGSPARCPPRRADHVGRPRAPPPAVGESWWGRWWRGLGSRATGSCCWGWSTTTGVPCAFYERLGFSSTGVTYPYPNDPRRWELELGLRSPHPSSDAGVRGSARVRRSGGGRFGCRRGPRGPPVSARAGSSTASRPRHASSSEPADVARSGRAGRRGGPERSARVLPTPPKGRRTPPAPLLVPGRLDGGHDALVEFERPVLRDLVQGMGQSRVRPPGLHGAAVLVDSVQRLGHHPAPGLRPQSEDRRAQLGVRFGLVHERMAGGKTAIGQQGVAAR